jgi:galactofuranosylgalactofuranosylrhamnosyl-N-acetylglucosaminyl-diphospho-decaprenol beta-1,5/1,6-galactofuranosyltransferase
MQEAWSEVRPTEDDLPGRPDASPEGAPSLILQSSSPAPSSLLWDQAFPARRWRSVAPGPAITVTADGGRAVLRGSRDGRPSTLGVLEEGRRRLSAAELDHDWLWLDGDVGTTRWSIAAQLELPPITVVMPTYRRETDAIAQVRRFLEMPVVATVIVIDQGGTLAAHPDFTRLRAAHDAVRLVTQENLGGSGGYARGMLEASQDPSVAVLFSDDDAVISGESLRRMLTYQALADRPTIMGTPLFSATEPTHLIAHTEAVGAGAFQWGPVDHLRGEVDLAGTTPPDWTFLAPLAEANYTGWWGTLFPPGTAADLGLPVPLFLKWDDAEYGLRATAHGYAHAVLPGTAVHHPPWTAYRTQMSWSAQVLHRNRLAIAAAYGAGRGVIGSSFAHQCKHILAGHLLTAELWQQGIDAFRAGPEDWLGSDLRRARTDGARTVATWQREHGTEEALTATRTRTLPLLPALIRSTTRMLRPDRPPRVVLAIPAENVHWRTTLGADAVIVTGDDGAPVSTFVVRGSAARKALVRTLTSHLDLIARWGGLRRQYRRALPRHTTADAWARLFGTAPDPSSPERT